MGTAMLKLDAVISDCPTWPESLFLWLSLSYERVESTHLYYLKVGTGESIDQHYKHWTWGQWAPNTFIEMSEFQIIT